MAVGAQWISAQAPAAAQAPIRGQQTLEELGGKGKKTANEQAGLGQKTASSSDEKKDKEKDHGPPSDPQVGMGQKNTSSKPADQKDQNTESKPVSPAEEAASTTRLKLGPLDPAPPPTGLPTNRPVIGLALGGGAASSSVWRAAKIVYSS